MTDILTTSREIAMTHISDILQWYWGRLSNPDFHLIIVFLLRRITTPHEREAPW